MNSLIEPPFLCIPDSTNLVILFLEFIIGHMNDNRRFIRSRDRWSQFLTGLDDGILVTSCQVDMFSVGHSVSCDLRARLGKLYSRDEKRSQLAVN